MEDSPSSFVERRKELMISPAVPQNPILRTAHFLKPSLSSDPEAISVLPPLSLPSLPPTFDPQNWPLKVDFMGWKNPPDGWNGWVHKMASLHALTWKKSGIYDAIFNSTCEFHRNRDLIFALAEKWCPDTNSFVFPWGEASITLEDMLISGYSALGFPVFEPIESEELEKTHQELVLARLELVRSRSQRAEHCSWLKKFMNTGSQIEHEAFLSLWLSRFVMPTSKTSITECVFPIAIHLARGTRIALAPTVLASIYRDLRLLKQSIVALTTLDADTDAKLAVTLWSPFQLVLIWVWERFASLRPRPNVIKNGEPRFARWNNLKCIAKTVRSVLDSSKETFSWRPYTEPLENWDMPKVYGEKEIWVTVDSDLDEQLLSFIRCLRVSDLVGLDGIVQYLPQRVARQFGFDQDVPGCVVGSKTDVDDAWSCYSRTVTDVKCYIPSRLFEGHVTKRYSDWWKSLGFDFKMNSSETDERPREKKGQKVNQCCREKTGKKLSNLHQMISNNLKKKRSENVVKKLLVSAASHKRKRKSRSPIQILDRKKTGGVSGAPVRQSENCVNGSDIKAEETVEMSIRALPPGFNKKCERVQTRDSYEDDSFEIFKIPKMKEKHDVSSIRQSHDGSKSSVKADDSSSTKDDSATQNISDRVQGEFEAITFSEIQKSKGNQQVTTSNSNERLKGEEGAADDYEKINESAKAAMLSAEHTIQRVEKLFAVFKSKINYSSL